MPDDTSYALPMHFYRNPTDVLESKQIVELGCRACDSHHRLLGKIYCTDDRNELQKGVPRVGIRCKFFKEGKV